jgi:hypothetical protein
MDGSMAVSLHLSKKTHEGGTCPEVRRSKVFKVLGNTIKKDLRPSEIE